MKFTCFSDALTTWRDQGGAMYYQSPTHTDAGPDIPRDLRYQDYPETWIVGDADAIGDLYDVDPREATIDALEHGGLSAGQIAHEMRDWQ